ncbi:MAG TPA: ParB/RepB/Spo0J family partition protein [Methylibium sp.]|nr:ParB/RepB/Spo0J family partition protein [Methylibium sp.]
MNAPDRLAAIERPPIDGAVYLPLTLIAPSPTNPRKHFDAQHLDELADSIRKHGVIQPILVRPRPGAGLSDGQPQYELVAGERRWRASKIADQPSIMALVREMSDFEVLELQVIENLQREDLHPLEEAEGYAALLRKPEGLQGYASAEELAARIGRSERYVYNRLALLKLVPQAREACLEGKISASVALLVAALPADDQPDATARFAQGWGGEPFSARAAAAYLRDHFSLLLKKAVFPIADAELVPPAGACTACPKRTSANPDLFTDQAGGGADSCLDRACFNGKTEANRQLAIEAHIELGHEVLSEAEARKLMPHGAHSLRGAYRLGEPCELASSRQPLRELLGAEFAKVVVLDLHGELHEVVREADVRKALKAQGLMKPPASKAEPRAPEPERVLPKAAKGKALTPAEIKKAREKAIAKAWPTLAREQLAKHLMADEQQTFTAGLQRLVVGMALCATEEKIRPMLQDVGMAWPGDTAYLDPHTIQKAVDQAAPQQLYALLVLAIAEGNEWELAGNPKAETPLRVVARELGFDLQPAIDAATEQVQAQMQAELEAQQPAAKKTAKAKSATETFVDAHAKPKASALKPAVKYRCPATGSTWSGRGLQPAWVRAALANGKTLDELLA